MTTTCGAWMATCATPSRAMALARCFASTTQHSPVGTLKAHAHPWFPGHMKKASEQLRKLLKAADVVVEVRDARAPLTAASDTLRAASVVGTSERTAAARRKHVVALNKSDLADPSLLRKSERAVAEDERRRGNIAFAGVVHTSCAKTNRNSLRGASPLLKKVREALVDVPRRARPGDPHLLIICGLPNVGKSALIAGLRRANSDGEDDREHIRGRGGKARVGPTPGVTRAVQGFELTGGDEPLWCLDSPGITAPRLREGRAVEHAMHLAIVHCVPEYITGGADTTLGYALAHVVPNAASPVEMGRPPEAVLNVHAHVRRSREQDTMLKAARAGSEAAKVAYRDGENDTVASAMALDAALVHMMNGTSVNDADPDRVQKLVDKLLKAVREGRLGRFNVDRDSIV